MKILLVSPQSPDTFWGLRHTLKFISKKATLPPLGLLTVAAMLPDDWNKKLVDMSITALQDSDILWADYVFISAMFIQRDYAGKIIDRCKKLSRKIVGGGPLFTATPEDYTHVDYLILNEAEITLPIFLEDLKNGNPKHIYKSDKWAAVEDTPVPLWRLINTSNYALMSIQYSRGCHFNCEFCDVTTLFGRKVRTKTKAQILQELEALYSIGYRGQIFIVDDNFTANRRKLKNEILPAIIEWIKQRKYPFSFNTQASIDLADDQELVRLMVLAGFDCVFIGIETTSEETLSECNKNHNTGRDLVACVKKIQRLGMQVQAGFIFGFDSDKPSIFENSIRFIQQSGIVTAMTGLLNAPRGSALYRRLVAENRLLNNSSGNNTDFSMNFIPKMNYQELINGYKKVLETIYSHKFYYQRIMTFLKNYRPLPKDSTGFDRCKFGAFLKSIWHFGIKSRGRFYYWRLILWSLRRPQYLELAITLSIYGFHFRKIFENYGNYTGL